MANSSGNLWIYSRHIYVFANYPAVSGSKHVDRDFVRARSILDPLGDREFWREFHRKPITTIPPNAKWCSQHDPRDNGGWVSVYNFSPDKRYHDGKHPVCKDCRAREERRRYASMKAEQGKTVRSYQRRETEQITAATA